MIYVYSFSEIPESVRTLIQKFNPEAKTYRPVWQSVSWMGLLLSSGQISEWYCVVDIDESEYLRVFAFVEKRSIGLKKFALFVVGWPIFVGDTISDSFLESLKTLARNTGSVFIQFEPVQDNDFSGFQKGYYKHFLENTTLLLDLEKTEEELFAEMKQKGRYNIRLAEKQEVTVQRVLYTEENLDIFMKLLSETLARDGFSGNSRKYYETLLKWRSGEWEGLYIATRNNEAIAAAILVIEGGTAVYYYGASTSDNELRKYMAAYLVQWKMIQVAKNLGCTIYDFLGIAPENAPESHRLAGVTDFKRKFGGIASVFPSPRIFVTHPVLYMIFVLVRCARSLIRRK